jgi:hypothetical protein
MTENSENIQQTQPETAAETPVVEQSTQKTEVDPVDTPVEKVDEKLVPQSKVNEVVGAAKKDAYEKARKEFEAQYPSSTVNAPVNNVAPNQPDVADETLMTSSQVRELINAEATRQRNEAETQQMITTFANKMEAGKSKYNDFEATVSQLDIFNNPELIPLANSMDNSSDVLYDLAKNPGKFASVLLLAKTNPTLAHRQFWDISNSIKANEAALRQPQADAPLDQINPSNTGTDNGLKTVSDLRKAPYLRG